jgi:hypothetical protein
MNGCLEKLGAILMVQDGPTQALPRGCGDRMIFRRPENRMSASPRHCIKAA